MSEIEKESVTDGAPAPAKKGGKKIIVIALLAVLVLGGGATGFYFWKIAGVEAAEAKKPDKKSAKKEAAADDEEHEKPAKKKEGAVSSAIPEDEDVKHVIELPPFIVNLADTDQARYLRMTVSLGVGEGAESEKPEALFMTRVRNAMLAVLSEKSSDQILTAEGKAKLRKELLSAAQAASEEPEVKAIYITDFIVQL